MFFGTRVLVGQHPLNVGAGNTTWQRNKNSIILTTLEGCRASSALKHASRNWRILGFVRLISSRLDRSSQCFYRIENRRSLLWVRRHITSRTERQRQNITKIAGSFGQYGVQLTISAFSAILKVLRSVHQEHYACTQQPPNANGLVIAWVID